MNLAESEEQTIEAEQDTRDTFLSRSFISSHLLVSAASGRHLAVGEATDRLVTGLSSCSSPSHFFLELKKKDQSPSSIESRVDRRFKQRVEKG